MRNDHVAAFAAVLLAACWAASCTSASSDCDLLVSCEKYATGGSGGAASSSASSGGISCQSVTDCPATTECATWACEAGTCKPTYSTSTLSSQVYGNCQVMVCDGMGHKISINDDNNVYEDADDCTDNTCNQGVPSNKLKQVGAPCSNAVSGIMCNGQGKCVYCLTDKDCTNVTVPTCSQGKCVLSTCTNKVKDGAETDVDCGGLGCAPCAEMAFCNKASDCVSAVCLTVAGMKTCQPPNCNDGKKNSNETDQDCGGPDCVPIGFICADGLSCKLPTDCVSSVCKQGVCQKPTCADGVKNGDETDIDCGGTCPMTCAKRPGARAAATLWSRVHVAPRLSSLLY